MMDILKLKVFSLTSLFILVGATNVDACADGDGIDTERGHNATNAQLHTFTPEDLSLFITRIKAEERRNIYAAQSVAGLIFMASGICAYYAHPRGLSEDYDQECVAQQNIIDPLFIMGGQLVINNAIQLFISTFITPPRP